MKNTFTTYLDLENHIKEQIETASKKEAMNIFVHQIFPMHDDVETIIMSIKKYGIMINYNSICNTMSYFGDNSNYDIEKLVHYSYLGDDASDKVLFLIPKYIVRDNKLVDFSTPQIRQNYGIMKANSVLDFIKSYHLNPEYTFGFIHIDEEKKQFEFDINPRCYSFIEDKKPLLDDINEKYEKFYMTKKPNYEPYESDFEI